MFEYADIPAWFSATAFSFGVGTVIVWWLAGLSVGILIDMVRKS